MALRPATAAVLIALFLVPAACGGDNKKSEGSGAVEALEIETAPGGVIGVASKLTAGIVDVTLKNSDKADHEAQLVKLEGGHTVKQAIKAIEQSEEKGIPAWIRAAGGVGSTPGGSSQTVTQKLEAGTYGIFDMEGERTLSAEFKVAGPGSDENLPATDASVTARDYSFSTDGLKAGKSQVLFKNTGKELHHVIAMRMRDGATIAQVKKFFETERGKPPVEEKPGESTAVIDGDKEQVVELDLKAGKYALVCFITDRKGGPPHAAKGMINEAVVR